MKKDESKKEVFKNTKTWFVSFACYLAIYYDENGKKLDNNKEYEDISKSIQKLSKKLSNLPNEFEEAEEKHKKDKYSNAQCEEGYRVIEIFENAIEQLSDKDNKLDSNYFKVDKHYEEFKSKVDKELDSRYNKQDIDNSRLN